jgi:hypothetical protein
MLRWLRAAASDSVPRVTEPLTVMFMPESAYGPTNQCIGLGKVLLDRGHRVVFAAEASWAGRLEPFGFVEALVDLAEPDPDAAEGAAGQFWIDFVNETAPEFAKPTSSPPSSSRRTPRWSRAPGTPSRDCARSSPSTGQT